MAYSKADIDAAECTINSSVDAPFEPANIAAVEMAYNMSLGCAE